jgi:hypothetical protein
MAKMWLYNDDLQQDRFGCRPFKGFNADPTAKAIVALSRCLVRSSYMRRRMEEDIRRHRTPGR